jgi:phosphoserine phosphatase
MDRCKFDRRAFGRHRNSSATILLLVLILFACQSQTPPQKPSDANSAQLTDLNKDPLPSWNDGIPKRAIVEFVKKTTTEGSPDFVPVPERIATFDNDGTLWVEQPMYTQLAFMLDRVKALAPQHPEWKQKQPFKAVLEGDLKAVAQGGEKALVELAMATHAGMTTNEFSKTVTDWIATAQHPRFHRLYTACVYQPMLELLAYLRASGFKTYIVSGGGIEMMRPWTEKVYGVPPEQVIGSSIKTKFEMRDGEPVLLRLPEIDFIDDKAGKPEGINKFIGRRPIAAFGNSDGDLEMLQWTAAGKGARLMLLVHHTDAYREYAYDRDSTFGRLNLALDEAKAKGWIVVDMKDDWKTIFPPMSLSQASSFAGQRQPLRRFDVFNQSFQVQSVRR